MREQGDPQVCWMLYQGTFLQLIQEFKTPDIFSSEFQLSLWPVFWYGTIDPLVNSFFSFYQTIPGFSFYNLPLDYSATYESVYHYLQFWYSGLSIMPIILDMMQNFYYKIFSPGLMCLEMIILQFLGSLAHVLAHSSFRCMFPLF